MLERFYCPLPFTTGDEVALDEAESHHLTHVLRLGVGTNVLVFDGRGVQAEATVHSLSKRGARLHIVSIEIEAGTHSGRRMLTLASAVPKGDRFRWMVEKAAELGVARLIPISTSRSVVDPRETKLDKMRQAVIAACKQSGRNRLMELGGTVRFREAILNLGDSATILMADPDGMPIGSALEEISVDRPLVALIGPEGGWTDEERAAARAAGSVPVALGVSILRIETAAVALAARCLIE